MKGWESLPHLPIIIDKFPTSMQMKCSIFYFINKEFGSLVPTGNLELGIGSDIIYYYGKGLKPLVEE
jgi:hypothetical protein